MMVPATPKNEAITAADTDARALARIWVRLTFSLISGSG